MKISFKNEFSTLNKQVSPEANLPSQLKKFADIDKPL